jgi:hypothetical protein
VLITVLNIFTIVKFPNEACWTGDALRAGIIYAIKLDERKLLQ